MTKGQRLPVTSEVRQVDSVGELLRVGWDRVWRFTPVLQRDTPERKKGSATWTWQWLIVGWLAVCLLPAVLLDVCAQSTRTHVVNGASALARPACGQGGKRARGAAAVWSVTFLVLVGFLLFCFYASSSGSAWAAVVAGVWSVAVLVFLVARLRDPAQSKPKALLARTVELTSGSRQGYAVSDVVASRDGTGQGTTLMKQLQQRWATESAVAVLYAASPSLVGYYRDLGWEIDESGDGQRMIWPAGLDRSGAGR